MAPIDVRLGWAIQLMENSDWHRRDGSQRNAWEAVVDAKAEIEKLTKQRNYYHDAWRDTQAEINKALTTIVDLRGDDG